jgi:dihydrofolate synthase/folylpolyglutamate synthase
MIALPQHPEANQVLGEVAAALGVRGVSAAQFVPSIGVSPVAPYGIEALGATVQVDSPLRGAHQHRNIALAVAAAVELADRHGFPVTPAGLAEGIRLTRWPGRLERIGKDGVEWIFDVAHNPAGAWALCAGLSGVLRDGESRTLIFGCLRDKPVLEMAKILFPIFAQVIVAPIHTVRTAPLEDLLAAAAATGTPALAADSVSQALQLALTRSAQRAQGGVIVVSGSVYLVGEARSLLLADRGRQP